MTAQGAVDAVEPLGYVTTQGAVDAVESLDYVTADGAIAAAQTLGHVTAEEAVSAIESGDLNLAGVAHLGAGLVVGGGQLPCDPEHAGAIHFDAQAQRLLLCTGTDLLQLKACSTQCAASSEVECAEPVTDGCQNPCGETGTKLSAVQCLSNVSTTPCTEPVVDACENSCSQTGTGLNATICLPPEDAPCGQAIVDACQNSCNQTGTGLNVATCSPPESSPCGQAIVDACQNPCSGVGTQCPGSKQCYEGTCVGLGGSPDQPASSCLEIRDAGASVGSGLYWLWLAPPGAGVPFEAWCEMAAEGGGWTLVMRMAPDGGLGYGSASWTEVGTFDDEASASGDPSIQLNAKLPAYDQIQGTVIRGCKGVSDGCLSTGMAGTKTVFQLMGEGSKGKNFSRAQFVNLFGNPGGQPHCNANGLNKNWGPAGYRFGLVGNNENECNSCDSAVGWGVYSVSNFNKACGAGLADWQGPVQCVHGTLWVR